jgi:hypothetical protein
VGLESARFRLRSTLLGLEREGVTHVQWCSVFGERCKPCTERDMKIFTIAELRALADTDFCLGSSGGANTRAICRWELKPVLST